MSNRVCNNFSRPFPSGRPFNGVPGIEGSVPAVDDALGHVPGLSLKTIKGILRGNVVEAKIITSIQDMASHNYLSRLLDLRGRLQELGAIFSPSSELIGYGNPSSHHHLAEMLRLGPLYEEQWNMFFAEYRTVEPQDTADLWPDLRTLKKMLSNFGVIFGVAHIRLNWGDSSTGIVRFCEAYDELREQWLMMMELHLPEDDDEDLQDIKEPDSEGHQKSISYDTRLGKVINDSIIDRRKYRTRSGSVPRDIGWRFSDDIERKTEDIEYDYRGSEELVTSAGGRNGSLCSKPVTDMHPCYLKGAFQSQLQMATEIALPISRPGTPRYSANAPAVCKPSGLRQVHFLEEAAVPSHRLTLLEALSITSSKDDSAKESSSSMIDVEKGIEFYKTEHKQEKSKGGSWSWLRKMFCLGR